MSNLWDFKHPYYALTGNYFSNDCHADYRSWESFIESEGDSDMDYNLVYRWDWDKKERTLSIFYVGQRKALHRSVSVFVLETEEELIKPWLEARWEHMRLIWAPFSGIEDLKEADE